VSQAVCVNNCNELGKVARVEAQKLAKLMKLGYEMRVQLSKKGKEIKQEKKVSSRWNVTRASPKSTSDWLVKRNALS
jgi:succinylglutamate desuccinylase